jgi:hypothetical protein
MTCLIDGLEDQEERPSILRVEPLLQFSQGVDSGFERFFRPLTVAAIEGAGVCRVEMLQAESAALGDPVGSGERSSAFGDFVELHWVHTSLANGRV